MMKTYWCIFLSLLFIMASFSACTHEEPTSTTEFIAPPSTGEFIDPLSRIMENPADQPQLTKDEFIDITKNYLSTDVWTLPVEKACFYTSGVNCSAYIVDDVYLFSLYIETNPDGSPAYTFHLSHYIDGVEAKWETNPLLFEDFLS